MSKIGQKALGNQLLILRLLAIPDGYQNIITATWKDIQKYVGKLSIFLIEYVSSKK